MTLTWNNSNNWATSASDEAHKKELTFKGLSNFGKKVILRMNQLGMLVDVSHVGEATFWDVINTSTKPVVATHSNVYTLCAHERNLKDEQIKAIADSGGIIHVNFFSGFLDPEYYTKKAAFIKKHQDEYDALLATGMIYYLADEHLFNQYKDEVSIFRAPFEILINHIEYIINLVGIDFVGLGSDFDGIESTPKLLDDVTSYPLITKALFDKGYCEDDIAKILGGNLLRVMEECNIELE
jgi:membrane dipeptidase